MFGFIVMLLPVIGLSNAWSTVRGTLEAILFGLTPILFSLPILVILQGVFLSINEVSFLEWLPYAPWLPLLLYIFSVLAVMVAVYVTGGRKLLRENIIEAIKVDFI